MMDDIYERVAVLEANHLATCEKLDEAIQKLDAINAQLNKYHGFLGAITFILSGVGVAWSLFGDWFKSHWS